MSRVPARGSGKQLYKNVTVRHNFCVLSVMYL